VNEVIETGHIPAESVRTTPEIRVVTGQAEQVRALEVFFQAFSALHPVPEAPLLEGLFEPGRTLVVEDGGAVVGTTSSFSSVLVVPGGARLPQAGVTDVGVLPTHTRRGLAGALLTAQLEDIARRGEPVATLRASEGVIYERFGYGIASQAARVELTMSRATLRPGLPSGGPVRFVDPATSWDLLERIYAMPDGVCAGTIDRPGYWWKAQKVFSSLTSGPSYVVVHGAPGAEDGFLRYRPSDAAGAPGTHGRNLGVFDFVVRSPEAYFGLLRFLFSIDLLHTVTLSPVPVDHSIEKLLLDERAARTSSIWDETWLRLIDVPTALAARTYNGDGRVAIAVSDRRLPANDGTYLVSAAGVSRTDAPAELSLDVSALATVYLGGTKWWQLAHGGRVTEHRAGALGAAEALFATERPPFAGTMF
jgi:predicted acetyltransferase